MSDPLTKIRFSRPFLNCSLFLSKNNPLAFLNFLKKRNGLNSNGSKKLNLFVASSLASVIYNNLGKLYYHVKDLCNQELCVSLLKFSSLCLTDFQPVSCSLSVLYLIEIKGLSSLIF